jgi:hypothetical protein
VLVAFVVFFWLGDGIQSAKWLSASEKALLQSNLERESTAKTHGVAAALKSPRVWLLTIILLTFNTGFYGLAFWLPSIIRASGVQSTLNIGLLSAIPYLSAVVVMLLNAAHSRKTGERRLHAAIPACVGGVGLILSALFANNIPANLLDISRSDSVGHRSRGRYRTDQLGRQSLRLYRLDDYRAGQAVDRQHQQRHLCAGCVPACELRTHPVDSQEHARPRERLNTRLLSSKKHNKHKKHKQKRPDLFTKVGALFLLLIAGGLRRRQGACHSRILPCARAQSRQPSSGHVPIFYLILFYPVNKSRQRRSGPLPKTRACDHFVSGL